MPIDPELLLVLKSAHFGADEPDLGAKLTQAFLSTMLESDRLPAMMICMAGGVFLTTEGSPVLDLLRRFESAGTRIRSCGTCLDYYGRRESLQVGEAGNMRQTVDALLGFKKVVQP